MEQSLLTRYVKLKNNYNTRIYTAITVNQTTTNSQDCTSESQDGESNKFPHKLYIEILMPVLRKYTGYLVHRTSTRGEQVL
jgi:hypothetical protein